MSDLVGGSSIMTATSYVVVGCVVPRREVKCFIFKGFGDVTCKLY